MSTEHLPDGLQLAVNTMLALGCGKSSDAIREEHAKCLKLQHHACDLAQRVADLEAERANTAVHVASIASQLGDEGLQVDDIAVRVLGLVAERDELRTRLSEIEAQEPVAWQSKFTNDPQWAHCTKEHYDWVRANQADWPNYQLRTLFARPVPVRAAPEEWRLALENARDLLFSMYAATAKERQFTPAELAAHTESAAAKINAALAAAPEHKA